MREACEAYVSNQLRDELTQRVGKALSASTEAIAWSIAVDANDPATLLFAYPSSLTSDTYGAGGYIRPVIRLEFGGRNEVWPAETHTIRPYCLDVFPDLSTTPSCNVNVLAAERTFWEKATLIHAEFHRPATSTRPNRVSRHYSDLARLARTSIGTRALEQLDLLRAVVAHKAAYFPSNWARYDETIAGQIHLVPHESLERVLRSDYAAMREMFFDDPEPFDDMLAELRRLEVCISELTVTR